jgi:tetratricopeptide (TPR) repeat protein
VVALDSPAARPRGSFNWGSALWHELAHTFHMGLTRHRVPRWFSEGLSVFEEHQARPGWGGDVTPAFLEAYRDGRLHPVSTLNNGFVRPDYEEQVIHSYYQASLVFAFIESRFGFDAIRAMLIGYGKGRSTPEVVRVALALGMDELDEAFDAWFRERFAGPLAALPAQPPEPRPEGEETPVQRNDYRREMEAARRAADEHELELAEKHLLAAQSLFPEYAGEDGSYWQLANLYLQWTDPERAAEQLERMVAVNAEHYESHVLLGQLRADRGDTAGAADALSRALYIHPYEPQLSRRLAELLEAQADWAGAARARAAVVALSPVDIAEAGYRLALAHARAGNRAEARRELLRALERAPNFQEALELLLEITGAGSRGPAPAPTPAG